MRYFISDPHFNDAGIIKFERTQFSTIEEHDAFLIDRFKEWAHKLKPKDELFVLGDWGNTDFLYVMAWFSCKTVFVRGNHDKLESKPAFEKFFDEVHWHPYFLSDKIVVSHLPVAVYPDTVNIHGHTHRSELCDPNHVCVSIDNRDYKLYSEKQLTPVFGSLPKYTRRFLYEPFAADYVFVKDAGLDDIVVDKHNRIDLSATRALKKFKELAAEEEE